MKSFLRTLRRQLFISNKFSKYATYAVGEIFLVVIGILIALQINNANNARIEQAELRSYLKKIANNIAIDIKIIDSLKTRRDRLRDWSIEASTLLRKRDYSNPDKLLRGGAGIYEFYFIPNRSGYDAFKNSKYVGEIKNKLLDSLLTNYYMTVNTIREVELSYNNYMESMEATIKKEVDITNFMIYSSIRRAYRDSSEVAVKRIQTKYGPSLLPYITHNAHIAITHRTSVEGGYRRLYPRLKSLGTSFIEEVNKY